MREERRDQVVRIEELLPQHIRSQRIPWWSFFDPHSLVQHLHKYPGISFHVEGENQYALGGFWRGRPDIGLILELTGSKDRLELINCQVESFRQLGCAAVVLSADEANRNAKWFLQQGWQVLDEIVIYTRRNCHLEGLPPATLPIEPFRTDQIDELLALERTAFPFLWWSGKEDFLNYVNMPEVRAYVLPVKGQMGGYVSFTLRGRQGYLDRIAVEGKFQGYGYGKQLLSFVLETLDHLGAKMVSLNTQITNIRAQHLYHKYGFIRTNEVERIYGRWLKRPEELADL